MPSERVLICGAGVAGSVLAFWLAKHDYQILVIERSRADQTQIGQGLEIEQPALKVVQAMGIMDKLNAVRTGEKGFNLVDQHSRSHALFEAGGVGPTGALEMMRGDQVQVLYKAADQSPNVSYLFSTTIQSLAQTQDKVIVELQDRNSKRTSTQEFDYVVGADGVNSRTRRLAMGSPEALGCFKRIGAYNAFFSVPSQEQDWPYSRLCHFPGRRILWLRPVAEKSAITSAYLIHLNDDEIPALREANAAGDRLKQKEAFAELYSGLGWETGRIIAAMIKAENFYSDDLTQVKLKTWLSGRVVLVGDSAWAPTPFTGQGNQLAIIGAWVLAQEMSRHRSPQAFESYQKRLRPYVEECQNIPLGGRAPSLLCPQTFWGIWLLRTILGFIASTYKLFSRLNLDSWLPSKDNEKDEFDLQIDQQPAVK